LTRTSPCEVFGTHNYRILDGNVNALLYQLTHDIEAWREGKLEQRSATRGGTVGERSAKYDGTDPPNAFLKRNSVNGMQTHNTLKEEGPSREKNSLLILSVRGGYRDF